MYAEPLGGAAIFPRSDRVIQKPLKRMVKILQGLPKTLNMYKVVFE
jgi:hypothetical protein